MNKIACVQRMMRIALIISACSVTLMAHAQMSLPGSFGVSPGGAATYTIPIQVPPGIAAIEPKLALNFSSQAGNGPLGVGWSVSGLSAIARCPQTTPQDGSKWGIRFADSDRFCLDGQRLILSLGNYYGAPQSEYRTEIESYSKVTAYGTEAGTGPSYFIVKTKAGLTMEFGNTTDSRVYIKSPGVTAPSTVRVWALNKVSDTKGNAMTVVYSTAATSGNDLGNYYPSRIDYTSNAVTGLPAASSVTFDYQTRPDVTAGYQGGRFIGSQQRLKSITTKTGGANVFVYSPTYETSPSTGRSRITSVSVCTAAGACLPATTITLPNATSNFVFQIADQQSMDACLNSCGSWQTLDANNDGKMDLIHLKDNSGNVSAWISNGNGTFAIQNYQVSDTSLLTGTWLVLDVDGDGKADLVHLKDDAGHVSVWRSNGDGTFAISNVTFTTDTVTSNGIWLVMDVDGDGLADLVHVTTNTGDMRFWKSLGNGTFAMYAASRATNSSVYDTNLLDGGSWQVVDINGDGLADLLHLTNNSGDVRVWKSNGDGSFTISQFTNTVDTDLSNGFWQVLDMNDDGLVDLLHFTTNSGDMRVWLSKGDGTFQVSQVSNTVDTALTAGSWQIVDVNGDGRQDLIHLQGTSGVAYLWTFDGKGGLTSQPAALPAAESCLTCGKWVAGDFRGEGYVDLMHLQDDSANYITWILPRNVGDMPSAISSGIGSTITWTMAALPTLLNKGTPGYTMSLPASMGTITTIPAVQVVAGVYADTGVGGTRYTTYNYDSMRVELNGRGYLGFNWTQATDQSTGTSLTVRQPATGLVTRTTYRLDFPYTGMTKEVGRGTNGTQWSNLSLTTSTYGCIDPSASSVTSCTVSPGKRYFVYPASITTTSKDLDGTALPQTSVINSNWDLYGNVGTVTTRTLNPDGSATDYSNTVTNTYAAADPTNWYLGRLLKSVVVSTGPTVPAPVVPGSGGLAPAAAPNLPPQLMSIILNLLLDD